MERHEKPFLAGYGIAIGTAFGMPTACRRCGRLADECECKTVIKI